MLRDSLKYMLTIFLVGALSFGVMASTIHIGTKGFTEQIIVGHLMRILLEDRGYDVRLTTGMSTTILREALLGGDIDLCMEYTGTLWITHAAMEFAGESPEQMYELAKNYDADNDIIWLDAIWCNNTYTLAVTQEYAEEHGLVTISDLADHVNALDGRVRIAVTMEFATRPDGLAALEDLYDISFDPAYVIAALAGVHLQFLIRGDVEVGNPFGTDPQIVEFDWVVLEDNLNFWAPYDLVPNVRAEVLEEHPGLADVLNELVSAFPEDPAAAQRAMTELNARVAIDGLDYAEAAEEFLIENGLITP